jgi:RNA polymerase sigma-70 factor, ECF subfamily
MAADYTFLLLQAGNGNLDAFDELVRLTQVDLQRFVRSFVGADEAGDVAQETFLRAWRSASTFTGSSNAKTWLFGVARHVVADHQRRHARRNRIRRFVSLSTGATADNGSGFDGRQRALHLDPEDGHRFDELSALGSLVDQLEPERREAFVLTQIAGFSYAEVAEICAVPIGTVRSRVARARASLAEAYQHAELGNQSLDSDVG